MPCHSSSLSSQLYSLVSTTASKGKPSRRLETGLTSLFTGGWCRGRVGAHKNTGSTTGHRKQCGSGECNQRKVDSFIQWRFHSHLPITCFCGLGSLCLLSICRFSPLCWTDGSQNHRSQFRSLIKLTDGAFLSTLIPPAHPKVYLKICQSEIRRQFGFWSGKIILLNHFD